MLGSKEINHLDQINKIDEIIIKIPKTGSVNDLLYLAGKYLEKASILENERAIGYVITGTTESYELVISTLEKAIETEENPIFYNLIGIAHLKLSKFELSKEHINEAENNFIKAFDINPTTIETHQYFDGEIREKYISAFYLSEIYKKYFSENISPISQNLTKSLKYSNICKTLDPTDKVYRSVVK